MCCSATRCAAVCHSVLQCVAVLAVEVGRITKALRMNNALSKMSVMIPAWYNVSQCATVCRSVAQCVVAQCAAVCCGLLIDT